MIFADELRKKSSGYDPTQEHNDRVGYIVDNKVKECICGIKNLCFSEAEKGKISISGYLGIEWEEYASRPTARVREANLEPFKDKRGQWVYGPPYSFDYGIDGPPFTTSNEDRLIIALRIKDGIMNGLKDCGFSQLSAAVVTKPHYKKGDFLGKARYSKTANELHFIYISISWV